MKIVGITIHTDGPVPLDRIGALVGLVGRLVGGDLYMKAASGPTDWRFDLAEPTALEDLDPSGVISMEVLQVGAFEDDDGEGFEGAMLRGDRASVRALAKRLYKHVQLRWPGE